MKSQKHNGFSLIDMLVVVGIVVLGVVFLLPTRRSISCGSNPNCHNNLRQISLALAQYNVDYNDRLPLVAYKRKDSEGTIVEVGWCETIYPYIRNRGVYWCPQGFAEAYGYTDYWFNSNLSGKNGMKIQSPSNVLVFGDGNDTRKETTASYHRKSLPPLWLTDSTSPSYRHKGGANYCFLDGRVKWLTPEEITNESTKNNKPTFAVE